MFLHQRRTFSIRVRRVIKGEIIMENIRFGIVGCGVIARFHARAIENCPGAVLTAACSKSYESAVKFCAEEGIEAFESYDALLKREDIDAVAICTPSGEHYAQIKAALEAGKHVLVEKPMCIRLSEAEEVIALAKEKGLLLCAVAQLRFSDSIREMKRVISDGHLGKIYSAALTMRYYRSQAYYDQAGWRGTWDMDGGGVLMNQGIHGVDMLCYLLGEVSEIKGFADTMGRNIEVEDTAAAALRFRSGAMAVIDASTCCEPGFPLRLVISGEKGTIALEGNSISTWTIDEPCRIETGKTEGKTSANDPKAIDFMNHARLYADFVRVLCEGGELVCSAEQGKLPLEIILGIYEDGMARS